MKSLSKKGAIMDCRKAPLTLDIDAEWHNRPPKDNTPKPPYSKRWVLKGFSPLQRSLK